MPRKTQRNVLLILSMTLSLVLWLNGCAQTGDKISETGAGDISESSEEIDVTEEVTIPEDNSKMDEGRFRISYETESYTQIGGEIKLIADFIRFDGRKTICRFKSLNTELVSVTSDGVVTGLSAGNATVRAYLNDEVYYDFPVTVLPENMSDAMKLAVRAHNSNIFVRKDLGIGAGTPVYYRDIYGSVSDILYNEPLEIDRTFEKPGTDNKTHSDGPRSKFGFELEYITVHYTGNMDVNATARNNAEYFAYTKEVSVHYVTGNDGVYACLDDSYISWNAGDRMNGMHLAWKPTGVPAPTDGRDLTPVWGIAEDGKHYTINGNETTVSVARRKDRIKVYGLTFDYKGTECPTFNKFGLPWKIVDGEYYMGNSWWCYRTTTAGAICGIGGDYNSISIESAVNPETDLWYTWHKTAQLVAKLLVDNNLDTTRVTGHHMWTQKDCPQPLLENDMEIWNEFMDMVRCEYDKILLGDAEFSLKVIQGDDICNSTDHKAKMRYNGRSYAYVQKPGRVFPGDQPEMIIYELTVNTAGGEETIRLASLVDPT